jgi:hypothetical protein
MSWFPVLSLSAIFDKLYPRTVHATELRTCLRLYLLQAPLRDETSLTCGSDLVQVSLLYSPMVEPPVTTCRHASRATERSQTEARAQWLPRPLLCLCL